MIALSGWLDAEGFKDGDSTAIFPGLFPFEIITCDVAPRRRNEAPRIRGMSQVHQRVGSVFYFLL